MCISNPTPNRIEHPAAWTSPTRVGLPDSGWRLLARGREQPELGITSTVFRPSCIHRFCYSQRQPATGAHAINKSISSGRPRCRGKIRRPSTCHEGFFKQSSLVTYRLLETLLSWLPVQSVSVTSPTMLRRCGIPTHGIQQIVNVCIELLGV